MALFVRADNPETLCETASTPTSTDVTPPDTTVSVSPLASGTQFSPFPAERKDTRCRLLALAAELRNTIWELAFSTEPERNDNTHINILKPNAPSPALTMICREVRNETCDMHAAAVHTFWTTNFFFLETDDAFEDDIDGIDLKGLSLCNRLMLQSPFTITTVCYLHGTWVQYAGIDQHYRKSYEVLTHIWFASPTAARVAARQVARELAGVYCSGISKDSDGESMYLLLVNKGHDLKQRLRKIVGTDGLTKRELRCVAYLGI